MGPPIEPLWREAASLRGARQARRSARGGRPCSFSQTRRPRPEPSVSSEGAFRRSESCASPAPLKSQQLREAALSLGTWLRESRTLISGPTTRRMPPKLASSFKPASRLGATLSVWRERRVFSAYVRGCAGVVTAKTSEAISVALSVPVAAEGFLPKSVRLEFGTLLETRPSLESDAAVGEEEVWRRLLVGTAVLLRVQSVDPSSSDPSGLPRFQLRLVVPEKTSTRLSAEELHVADLVWQAVERLPTESENALPRTDSEWSAKLRRQPVGRVLRALSPPTPEWMLPANLLEKAEKKGFGSHRLPLGFVEFCSGGAGGKRGRLQAPPSRTPQRCRVVGLVRELRAAVVRIEGEDSSWLEELREAVAAAQPWTFEALHVAGGKKTNARADSDEAVAASPFAPPWFGSAEKAYAAAERALRVEQHTSRNLHRQEELLAFQSLLQERVGGCVADSLLENLVHIFQPNPAVRAYQQQLYLYPKTQRASAGGTFALVPLREIQEFLQEHPKTPAGFNTPHMCEVRARQLHAEERKEAGETPEEGGLLWLSIHPAVPMRVAHMLLHDAPVPFIAPYLRLYERQELLLQQFRHRSFLESFALYHEGLAQRRAALRERKLAEREAAGEGGGASSDSKKPRGAASRKGAQSSLSEARPPKALPKGSSMPPPSPEQVPMAQLWWTEKSATGKMKALNAALGPYFFRWFLGFANREAFSVLKARTSSAVLDPLGEAFQDITEWIEDPVKSRLLTPKFTKIYVESLRAQLLYIPQRAFASVFRRLLEKADKANAQDFQRVASSALPPAVKRDLVFFVRLRRWIWRKSLDGNGESGLPLSEEASGGELPKTAFKPVHLSPVIRLMKLHFASSRIAPPLPEPPSVAALERKERLRESRRKERILGDASLFASRESHSVKVQKAPLLAGDSGQEKLRNHRPLGECALHSQEKSFDWTSPMPESLRKFLNESENTLERMALKPPPVDPPDPQIDGFGSSLSSEANFKPRDFFNYLFEDLSPTSDDPALSAFQYDSGGDGPFPEERAFVPVVLSQENLAGPFGGEGKATR